MKDKWITKAFLMTFFIALIFNSISNILTNNYGFITLLIITIIFILIGIFFDIIGTAVLTADEAVFHSMSSNKVIGAKESVFLVKNQDVIASICNDVIGDICGIVSGSTGAILSIAVANHFDISTVIVTIIISSIISSLTVGGKAIGKKYSIKNCNTIIKTVGKFISIFNKKNR